MDTSVLLNLIHEKDQSSIIRIQNFAKNKKINFILLEDILTEWTGIEGQKKYNFTYSMNRRIQLVHELERFGMVTEIPMCYNGDEYLWAEKLYRSKKYIKPLSRETLSHTDCRLLKFALDNTWTLVTLDHLLIRAYCIEMRILGLGQKILVPEDWVWEA